MPEIGVMGDFISPRGASPSRPSSSC